MHGDVGAPVFQRVLEFLDEQALATDLARAPAGSPAWR